MMRKGSPILHPIHTPISNPYITTLFQPISPLSLLLLPFFTRLSPTLTCFQPYFTLPMLLFLHPYFIPYITPLFYPIILPSDFTSKKCGKTFCLKRSFMYFCVLIQKKYYKKVSTFLYHAILFKAVAQK